MTTPVAQLERLVHHRVQIQLKDQRLFLGRLAGLDEHLNLVLDDAEERTPERTRHLGRLLLRGSHIVTLRDEGAGGTSRDG